MAESNSVKYFKNELNSNSNSNKENVQGDIKLLKIFFTCGKYIGVTPLYSGASRLTKTFVKVLTIGIILAMFAYTYFSISYKADMFSKRGYIVTHLFLYGLWSSSEFGFITTCFLNSNVYRQDNWKLLFQLVDQMEMSLHFYRSERKRKLYIYIAPVFLNLISIALHFYYVYNLTVLDWNRVYFFGSSIAHIYMVFLLLLVLHINQLLRNRYELLNDEIINLRAYKNNATVKLREAMKLYKMFGSFVDQINIIFGWNLFIFVEVTVVFFLFGIVNVLSGKHNYSDGTSVAAAQFGMTIAIPLIYIISLTVLIMSCDRLEKSGKEIIKSCYMLHESVRNEQVKEQLFLLAAYADQWKPTLSAAGFYDLNQKTLSILFEAVITYLVIIIQFNLALV